MTFSNRRARCSTTPSGTTATCSSARPRALTTRPTCFARSTGRPASISRSAGPARRYRSCRICSGVSAENPGCCTPSTRSGVPPTRPAKRLGIAKPWNGWRPPASSSTSSTGSGTCPRPPDVTFNRPPARLAATSAISCAGRCGSISALRSIAPSRRGRAPSACRSRSSSTVIRNSFTCRSGP